MLPVHAKTDRFSLLLPCQLTHGTSPSSQGFSDPYKFDPDRFSPERKEDIKYAKNFLTFGWGPHYCVGESSH